MSLEPLAGGRASWGWAHDMAADGKISLTLRESSASGGSSSASDAAAGDMSCWAVPNVSQGDDESGKGDGSNEGSSSVPFPTSRFSAGCSGSGNDGQAATAGQESDSSWQSSEL